MASRLVTRDQSTVGQAAPKAEALHNPVSLMQDLKSTTDSRGFQTLMRTLGFPKACLCTTP